jgi:hypothetical protein
VVSRGCREILTVYYGARLPMDVPVCCQHASLETPARHGHPRHLVRLRRLVYEGRNAGHEMTPLDSTPFEQRLKIDLRVRNPNDDELQVTGIDVRWDLNGKRLACGLGNRPFTVPRLSDPVVAIETMTSTPDLVRQLLGLRKAQALVRCQRSTTPRGRPDAR